MHENNEGAPAPVSESMRASVQRGSHVWSSTRRNFLEDAEYNNMKQSVARPEQLRGTHRLAMQNVSREIER